MAGKMQGVPRTSELFREKLRYAIRHRGATQSAIARELGITPQAFQKYLSGSAPTPQQLAVIAREIEIDLNWLCNDADDRTEPPRPGDITLQNVPREDMVHELARTMRLEAVELRRLIEWAKVNTDELGRIAVGLLANQKGVWEDQGVRQALYYVGRIASLALGIDRLDPVDYSVNFHFSLPGALQFEPEELTPKALERDYEALLDAHPGIEAIDWVVQMVGASVSGDDLSKSAVGLGDRSDLRDQQLDRLKRLLESPTMSGRSEWDGLRSAIEEGKLRLPRSAESEEHQK